MNALPLILTVFIACVVEAVEALTIVLATGITREWRSTFQGMAAALVALAVITAAVGPAINELIHGLPAEVSASVAYAETVGACACACLAAVNEGLGTCLHMIAAPSKQDRVKEILGVPEHILPVWVQLVGYPAEDPEAGGQRPRWPADRLWRLRCRGPSACSASRSADGNRRLTRRSMRWPRC